MFTRIREAARIITWKPARIPAHAAPNYVIAPQPEVSVTRAGDHIARYLQVLVVCLSVGYAGGKIARFIEAVTGQKRLEHSLPIIAGIVSVVLLYLLHHLRNDLETKIHKHLNLRQWLAPYFGRHITSVTRVVRG